MNKKAWFFLLSTGVFCCSSAAWAGNVPTAQNPTAIGAPTQDTGEIIPYVPKDSSVLSPFLSIDTLSKKQQELALLNLQLQIDKVKKAIIKTEEKPHKVKNAGSTSTTSHSMLSQEENVIKKYISQPTFTAPTVLSIFGYNGEMYASLRLSNGGILKVHSKESIPPYGYIQTVSSSGVVMVHKGKPISLAFYAPSDNQSSTGSSQMASLGREIPPPFFHGGVPQEAYRPPLFKPMQPPIRPFSPPNRPSMDAHNNMPPTFLR